MTIIINRLIPKAKQPINIFWKLNNLLISPLLAPKLRNIPISFFRSNTLTLVRIPIISDEIVIAIIENIIRIILIIIINFLTISNSDATDGLYNSINQEPTINVATLLPSVYMNLTLDNFSLIDVSPFNGTTTPSGGQTSLFGSYNPTTGILQMNKV